MEHAMKERPILFSSPMVRAILDGRKTQTRRVMVPQPEHLQLHEWRGEMIYEGEHRVWCWKTHTFENLWDEYIREPERLELSCMSPYGIVGDRLWVREAFAYSVKDTDAFHEPGQYSEDTHDIVCRATSEGTGEWERHEDGKRTSIAPPWKPGIHMPRWASRIMLEITEVRVQLLQEIEGEDAAAEGIAVARCGCEVCAHSSAMCPADASAHIEEYAALWDSINGKRAPWSSNPWVWALTFRRSS
jgi:hypothetical protein